MGKSCGQHDFVSLGGQYYSLGQARGDMWQRKIWANKLGGVYNFHLFLTADTPKQLQFHTINVYNLFQIFDQIHLLTYLAL